MGVIYLMSCFFFNLLIASDFFHIHQILECNDGNRFQCHLPRNKENNVSPFFLLNDCAMMY